MLKCHEGTQMDVRRAINPLHLNTIIWILPIILKFLNILTENPAIFKSEINLSILYLNITPRNSPKMCKLDYLQYLFSTLNLY